MGNLIMGKYVFLVNRSGVLLGTETTHDEKTYWTPQYVNLLLKIYHYLKIKMNAKYRVRSINGTASIRMDCCVCVYFNLI
jgi:hypothetical protein